jgi:hypothetical protein
MRKRIVKLLDNIYYMHYLECSQWTGHSLQNAHFQTKKPLKGGPMLRKEWQEVT